MILVLPVAAAAEDAVYAYAASSGAGALADHGYASLAQLPVLVQNTAPKSPRKPPRFGRGGKTDVVVLAPALMLSWHALELPVGIGPGSSRLRAVLEGLLDEQLLDELAELHLALAPDPVLAAGAPRHVWVCVCDAHWLAGHLKALDSLGIGVARVVPEFSPHDGPLQLHVVSAGVSAVPQIVATGGGVRGVARLPLSRAALGWVAAGESLPAPVVLAEPELAETARQALACAAVELPVHQRWQQAVQASSWNLAQWGLASTRQTRLLKRLSRTAAQWLTAPRWRLARWGAGAFLLVNLVGLNLLAWQAQAALTAKRTAMNTLLVQTFPTVQVVVDAPLQMEREMVALRRVSGVASAQDIESILVLFGQFAPSGKIPDSIDFVNHTASVKGLQLNPQEQADLLAQLDSHGYNARMQDASVVVEYRVQGEPGAQVAERGVAK